MLLGKQRRSQCRRISSILCSGGPISSLLKSRIQNNEQFTADIEIANYSSEEINNKNIKWALTNASGQPLQEGIIPLTNIKIGGGNIAGKISCSLSEVKKQND